MLNRGLTHRRLLITLVASMFVTAISTVTATASPCTGCEIRSLPRIASRATAFGGTASTYATRSGTPVTYITPPHNFDARTATREELAAFGIPLEPSHSSAEISEMACDD